MAVRTVGLTKEIIAERKKAEAERKKAVKSNTDKSQAGDKKSEE